MPFSKKCSRCKIMRAVSWFFAETEREYKECGQCRYPRWRLRRDNREKINAYEREYYSKNPGKYKTTRQRYVSANVEETKRWSKIYRTENPGQLKIWKRNNREKVRKYEKRYYEKYPFRRAVANMRRRVSLAIQAGKSFKTSRLFDLLGCQGDVAKKWIESQFTAGMSWANYGAWHIDHILPCRAFDLSDECEQKRCFHYANLQPLWASDNLKKWCHIKRGGETNSPA